MEEEEEVVVEKVKLSRGACAFRIVLVAVVILILLYLFIWEWRFGEKLSSALLEWLVEEIKSSFEPSPPLPSDIRSIEEHPQY